MDKSLWLLMLACALGTFLLRALPLIWMRRHLDRLSISNNSGAMPIWLTVLAPTMIAAMFGVSLVPAHPGLSSWLATLSGGLCTILVWRRTRSLGWPVCGGVAVYGVVVVLLRILA
ncbi:MAG: AzlD domain-containing protein [Gammaproteobacteria bacterium]|nr:AzlD domain-containing protein [Gammaproteobacteria bacterium]MBU2057697.1 AzlD domain-containing protein [Gammaproteobacteria bacterium]MBU2176397.1 AzlD domain-containing protein [Gammaproteobacteria bacterium]MBU2246694.1 AzlD domain-containing protein [Gammaproteobacteria bacterium]MBU2345082.1 AzlD domain-containing protein [Gammaproteobacteria bacterium]